MEYKDINESWEKYKETIREPFADLKLIEKVLLKGTIINVGIVKVMLSLEKL